MPIVVLGLSHRSSPVTVRERFAFPEAIIPQTLASLRAGCLAAEAVILSTCNRVEIYAATPSPAVQAILNLRQFVIDFHNYREPLTGEIYAYEQPSSVEHLFKVACGLDSMVIGETEILGQLKNAYDIALKHKHTGAILNKTFQRAFNVAKHVRTNTNIQRGNVSVASVAVDLAGKIFNSLESHDVLVIGAGDTGEKTARALLSRGAKKIWVANRSIERAVALAKELDGRAIAFDQWSREFHNIDIVISSTAAPGYVLTRTMLEPLQKARKGRPLLLIDIAVPRDIDPDINLIDNVYLYNIDDLQAIADACLIQRREEIALCESIIRDKASDLLRGLDADRPRPGSLAS